MVVRTDRGLHLDDGDGRYLALMLLMEAMLMVSATWGNFSLQWIDKDLQVDSRKARMICFQAEVARDEAVSMIWRIS